jgi:preprotein translocase subunit YajC
MEHFFWLKSGNLFVLLAEQAKTSPSLFVTLIPMVLMFAAAYFILMRPERRRRSEHETMLGNLKKNDRVLFGGGIYGTVVNVQKGTNDVTIRVDDSSNTRLRVVRQAITRIVTGEEEHAETN